MPRNFCHMPRSLTPCIGEILQHSHGPMASSLPSRVTLTDAPSDRTKSDAVPRRKVQFSGVVVVTNQPFPSSLPESPGKKAKPTMSSELTAILPSLVISPFEPIADHATVLSWPTSFASFGTGWPAQPSDVRLTSFPVESFTPKRRSQLMSTTQGISLRACLGQSYLVKASSLAPFDAAISTAV